MSIRAKRAIAFIVACIIVAVGITVDMQHPYGHNAEKDGFLGVKWGVGAEQIPLLGKREPSVIVGVTHFNSPVKSERLCGAYIKNMSYGFYNNRFNYAQFEFNSSDSKAALIRCYTKEYGYEPKVTTKIANDGIFIEATWFKDSNAWTMLKYNTVSETGRLNMLYFPIVKEEYEKKEKDNKKISL